MFEIEVVSNPGAAFDEDGWIRNENYRELPRVDEALVKPALLLADRVTLSTFRADFNSAVNAAAFSNSNMPMRFLHAFAGVCRSGDEALLLRLGLDKKFLPTEDELKWFESTSDVGSDPWWEAIGKFEKKYSTQILDYRNSYGDILRSRHDDLLSPGLDAAVKSGVLDVRPWNADDLTPFELNWQDMVGEYFEDAIEQMAERIAGGTTPLAIDPGARALIQPAGESSGFASEATIHVSTLLANQVPGVSLMTIEELLDFREQNLQYLIPFRAAMLDIAKEISTTAGMSPAEIERLTKIAWARDAEPALKELEFQLDEAGFGRTFIQTLIEDKGAVIAAGASLVMGFGTLFAGFAALLPATVAAAYPVAKTFYARAKSERTAKQNRLYFVYKAGSRSKGKGEA